MALAATRTKWVSSSHDEAPSFAVMRDHAS